MIRGRWLACGAGVWALWRLLGPRPAPRGAAGQERPSGPPGRTVFAAGHESFVRETGREGGPRVLLLHGWAFDSLAAWHRVIPLLAGEARLVAVDLRGHGKTDRLRERYSVEDLADDVAAVLDALGPGRYTVVGYSLGGVVAQALARRYPARVERLVLAATASRVGPGPRAAAVPLLLLQRALGRLGCDVVPRVMYHYLMRTGAFPPEHSIWLWETLASRDNELHHETGFALARFDSGPWVGRLDLPVRCIIPTRDQLVPPARQRATAAAIPGAEVVEVPGARHEALFTHAADLAAAIREFIGPAPGGADEA